MNLCMYTCIYIYEYIYIYTCMDNDCTIKEGVKVYLYIYIYGHCTYIIHMLIHMDIIHILYIDK
jgi:hypothetical protein